MTFRKLLTVQNKNIQNYLVPKLELECGDVLEDVDEADKDTPGFLSGELELPNVHKKVNLGTGHTNRINDYLNIRKQLRDEVRRITGQDVAYLSRYLINKGYEVYGGIRRGSTDSTWRLEELGVLDQIKPIFLELLEESNINYIVKTLKVQEIYNLAAMSFVRTSFDYPVYTANVVGLGAMRFLEAIRQESPNTRFYQASSSEMFGKVTETPQNENTQFYPRSPYAIGKAFAHFSVLNYRESYGIHASSGILFNHESPLRGLEFVTRKITSTLTHIANGEDIVLELGNINAQ